MSPKKPLLLLIDGHALIYRAFHALPPLSVSRTGEMVSAVYGFASMLMKVIDEVRPTHFAVAFDRAAPTFRHERFKEYKANRPPLPDELVSQFQRVRELVAAFRIPSYELDGYEADDILGALARQATESDVDSLIVTGDYDVMQLISPRVRVLTSRRGFSDTVILDEAAVIDRYGLTPAQMADFRGLKGDPSDNIPGVPGIGEKTATRLLREYENLDAVYTHLNEIKPDRIREALRTYEAQARLSSELATIDDQTPVTLDLEKCHISQYDRDGVVALFRELEFHRLLDKLPQTIGDEPESASEMADSALGETDYITVTTEDQMVALVDELSMADSFTIDTETTSLDAIQAGLVGISLSTIAGRAHYIPVGHVSQSAALAAVGGEQLDKTWVLDKLQPLLEDETKTTVAHNANYDFTVLAGNGLAINGPVFDTMVAAHLLNENSLGLKDLAFRRFGVEMTPITKLIGTGSKQISMAQVEIDQAAPYACADADLTGRIRKLFEAELKEQGLWKLFTDVEMPLVRVLVTMERTGVALDTAILGQMSREMGQQLGELETEIYGAVGHQFNINSPQQLGSVLFDELGLPKSRKTKTGYSTAAAVLEDLRDAHPVIGHLLEYRQLSKLKSTYLDALPALVNPDTGRVHTTFSQTGTSTGRLSSSNPNLQNIPIRTELGRQVRRAFVANGDGQKDRWLLMGVDYSQIDLRVLAHLSQDGGLLEAFHKGEDVHASTAADVFGITKDAVTSEMRRVAKTVNFGVVYGMSDFGLARGLGLSRDEAGDFIRAYFEKYPGVQSYMNITKLQAADRGYVETLLGRRRYIPEITARNAQVRGAAERMAINMPVQGTSADIIKVAMVQLQHRLEQEGLASRMILQVHDELLFEVPEDEIEKLRAIAEEIMPSAIPLSVPVKVDIKLADNWGEME